MTITLSPEQERLVDEAMRSGSYQDPQDVIARALEDQWIHDHKADVAAKIDRAFDQFERGEFFTSEQSRADMEQRKAKWLHDQRP